MGSYHGNVIDLAAFRRMREQEAGDAWTGALLWDRESRREPARDEEDRRSSAGERRAWALDIGASLSVAVMAAAFVMRAVMF